MCCFGFGFFLASHASPPSPKSGEQNPTLWEKFRRNTKTLSLVNKTPYLCENLRRNTGLSPEAAEFLRGDDELETTTFRVKTEYSMLGVEEV